MTKQQIDEINKRLDIIEYKMKEHEIKFEYIESKLCDPSVVSNISDEVPQFDLEDDIKKGVK